MPSAERANDQKDQEGIAVAKEFIYIKDCEKQTVRKDIEEAVLILQKWFNKLKDGTHIYATPDPFFKIDLPQERIDRLIAELDDDFDEFESWRITSPFWEVDEMPDFYRLCQPAKKAMVQELFTLWAYQDSHEDEYMHETVEDPEEPIQGFCLFP